MFKCKVQGASGGRWEVGAGAIYAHIVEKKYENTSRTGGSEWRSLMNNSVHRLLTRPGALRLLPLRLRPPLDPI